MQTQNGVELDKERKERQQKQKQKQKKKRERRIWKKNGSCKVNFEGDFLIIVIGTQKEHFDFGRLLVVGDSKKK